MALASPAYSFAPCRAAPFTDNKDSFTPLYSDLTEKADSTFDSNVLSIENDSKTGIRINLVNNRLYIMVNDHAEKIFQLTVAN